MSGLRKETVALVTTTAISLGAIVAGVALLIWGPAEHTDLAIAMVVGGCAAGGLPSARSAWTAWREGDPK
jgi:hypothetical protein